jgi:membrane protease YdiL (CAAX protease family)
VSFVLPHTPVEYRWFRAVAVTAGVCEELLYRGFAVWALAPWLTLWGAAAASVILFGLGHGYQGRKGATRATIVGAVLGALALATGSIVPGVIVHAIVDLGAGAVSYSLLRERPAAA